MNLDELKEAAQAATPGPWELRESNPPRKSGLAVVKYDADDREEWIADCPPEESLLGGSRWWLNARYIALANPDAILALLTRLEVAEAALRDIAKGEGRFSSDHLTHAMNTVEDMKRIATVALAVKETP